MKTDCKYFNSCGSKENCARCSGYEKGENNMKSVKEIKGIISKLTIQAEKLEKRGGELLDEAKSISNTWGGGRFSDVKVNPDYTKWCDIHAEADNAYIKAGEVKRVIAVWRHNLQYAKKAELLPVWIEIMTEYQGKKIGEVREKEIREKFKKKGISAYFSKYEYSSPKINLAYLDNNGCCYGGDYLELTGNYEISFFDNDNKFVLPELETFKFYAESIGYIENPKQYIKQLLKAAEKAKKAAAVYDTCLHEYNRLVIPGFNQIDEYKTSSRNIAEYFSIYK